jgi:WD40 repeat protein
MYAFVPSQSVFSCLTALILFGCKTASVRGDEFQFYVGHTLTGAALSPNGKTLAVCGKLGITTWDLATGKRKTTLKVNSVPHSVAFSTDGGMILSGYSGRKVRLWRLSTGEPKWENDEHNQPVTSVAVCPDGKLMASASGDKTVRLIDPNGKELATLKGHEKTVYQVAFIPDRHPERERGSTGGSTAPRNYKTLASVSEDHTVIIWDLEERKAIAKLKGHKSTVYCVAPSPNGEILATGSSDGTVRLWDTSLDKQQFPEAAIPL